MITASLGNFLFHVEPTGDSLFLSFQEGKFECVNALFRKVMENQGIKIPPNLTSEFAGRRTIYPEEEGLFEKAFREVYFPLYMPKNEYYWAKGLVFAPEEIEKAYDA